MSKKAKRKIPAWVAKMLLVIAALLLLLVLIAPVVLALAFSENIDIAIYYVQIVYAGYLGGSILIIVILTVLGSTIGFYEKPNKPMCYALLQKGAEDHFLDISTSLRENGYRLIENSGSEVFHKAMLFMKTTSGSFDYGFSVFLSNDSMDDSEAEQFFAEIDILINEMVEKHKEEWTNKPVGMGILVLVPSQSVDLKLFLEENSVQDIKKSTVSGAIVLDDGNAYIANQKEVFAKLRYKAVQKEFKKVLEPMIQTS